MVKAAVDTNVYISAILFGGKPEAIVKLAAAGKIELIISPDILAEISSVLRKKFGWSSWQIAQTDLMLREITFLVTPSTRIEVIKNDDADNRILECALEGDVDFIVTGDTRHLLPILNFAGKKIVTVSGFLAEIGYT